MVLLLQLGCAIAMSPFNSAFLTCATCLGASVLARARAENLPFLSLALKAHAEKVAGYFKDGRIKFDDFKSYVTTPAGALMTPDEWDARVKALLSWFDKTGTLWVSNGPYMLTYYSSEEQKLILEAFRDPTYPFGPKDWVDYGSHSAYDTYWRCW